MGFVKITLTIVRNIVKYRYRWKEAEMEIFIPFFLFPPNLCANIMQNPLQQPIAKPKTINEIVEAMPTPAKAFGPTKTLTKIVSIM